MVRKLDESWLGFMKRTVTGPAVGLGSALDFRTVPSVRTSAPSARSSRLLSDCRSRVAR